MTHRLTFDPLTGQEDDDVMRRIKKLGAPPANTFGPPPTRPAAAGPLDAPPPTTNFDIPPTRPMAGPLDGPPAAGTGAREVELSARRRTNAAHSASVDATERAWASRPPVGANSLSARASASDGAVRSGPLSTRPATPVGSGRGMTPERRLEIAARRGDQRANLALFNADQWGRGGRGMAPPMRTPVGAGGMMPPSQPAFTPPAVPDGPDPFAPEPAQPAARPMQTGPQTPGFDPPAFDMSNMLPPMPMSTLPPLPPQAPFRPDVPRFDPMAPLPPSTLMGGSGVPGPPAIDFRPLPGNPGYGVPVINGEVQRQFLPMPRSAEESGVQMTPVPGTNLRIPTMGGARVSGLPTFQEEMVPGSLVRRETQGQPAPTQLTPQAENITQMPKFQQDKDSGKMFYIEPNGQGGFRRKWVDEDGDGTVSPAERAKAGAAGGRPVSPFVAAFGNQ